MILHIIKALRLYLTLINFYLVPTSTENISSLSGLNYIKSNISLDIDK